MRIAAVLGAVVLALHPFITHAADEPPIGRVKRVTGTVLLDRAGKTLPVTPGMPLQTGDRIRTGADGLVGVTLADDTLLSAGKGSRLLINEFRFDTRTHEGGMLATLSQGSLHVVTGLIAKKAPEKVNFRTPSTVLGVRGTDFIVEVPAGAAEAAL
ncbi:FecR domain-containing protein [Pelomonas sp. KK5]|uniref:FecR family protein n=1 Tax=Pelomonas sp. KK5 TaxID=1855730 RepID=UPI00097BDC4E|nr:FecR domain-containing protein [Pelomonas sp. KK5]